MRLPIQGSPRSLPPGSLLTTLDVGTENVVALVARVDACGTTARIVGVGHHAAQGVKSGAIVDLEAVQAAIGSAVATAEKAAGETIRSVVSAAAVSVVTGERLAVDLALDGEIISDEDVDRALAEARMVEVPGETELIHALPIGFRVNGGMPVTDPRGMASQSLSVELHAVAVDSLQARNLESCCAQRYLDVDRFCASAYAAGIACLVEDEMDLGAIVIDLGAGSTDIAVFRDRRLIHLDSVRVGGAHVTNDIAHGLSTGVADAERIKTLHGIAIAAHAEADETIDVRELGETDPPSTNSVPRSFLGSIIQPRLEETFELVRGRLEDAGVFEEAGRRVVLTGGASQMPCLRELAHRVLEKQVRLGRPIRLGGLSGDHAGPQFATAAGLVTYALTYNEPLPAPMPMAHQSEGLLARVGNWIRENL